jgi:hypothetical protein
MKPSNEFTKGEIMSKLGNDLMKYLGVRRRDVRMTIELMAKYPSFKKTTFKLLRHKRKLTK